jgi:2-dehydropantoate 2-reductase
VKIAVLGAGSLGCALGGVLAERGNEVVLLNHNAEFCEVVNANGLTLNEGGVGGQTRVVRVQAWQSVAQAAEARSGDAASSVPAELRPQTNSTTAFDLIIVLVKSKDTEAVVHSALPWVAAQTLVMSLQNGLGHEDIIANIVGRSRVLAGKTYCGGLMTVPGVVTLGIKNKETIIGELDGALSPRVQAVGKAFNDAGLLTTVSPNIMGAMWDKILVNVATGAISGITRLVYGHMYQVPELERTACAAVAEAMAVAKAKGIALSMTEPKAAWDKAGKGLPFEFKASMLQTLEKHSVTEVDYINGAVVIEGQRLGVPTPVNDTLLACIKGIEKGLSLGAQSTQGQHPF